VARKPSNIEPVDGFPRPHEDQLAFRPGNELMNGNLYDSDFFGWTRQQGELLKSGRFEELDTEHLIEEIEAMGRSERQQLTRRLEILLIHLLKWRYQPEFRGRSWQLTILEQRRRIAKLLAANPSLQAELQACFLDGYDDARFGAMRETGLALEIFPEQPEMDLSKALAPDYWPE
jgi:hypothetical protein